MIEIIFREFFEYRYRDDEYFELYAMKNGLDEILYVGISSQNEWNRWFGWSGHITAGDKFLVGESEIGRMVVYHLPNSWDWKIQLWKLDDCVEFCADALNPAGRYNIKLLEPLMIQKLRLSLNVAYNLNPELDHTPKSDKEKQREIELDKAYRNIFEKKNK
jgi:hypothetical protein